MCLNYKSKQINQSLKSGSKYFHSFHLIKSKSNQMNTKNLKESYYIFGNKGNVWNNECHIAQAGSWTGRTLCDVPMLSTNWARIEEVTHIGCKECNKIYNQKIKNND